MVWRLLDSICLVTKDGQPVQNRLVSGSEALHHVLPTPVLEFSVLHFALVETSHRMERKFA